MKWHGLFAGQRDDSNWQHNRQRIDIEWIGIEFFLLSGFRTTRAPQCAARGVHCRLG